MKFKSVNDLSKSKLRNRFSDVEFKPVNNLAVAMGRVSTKKQKSDSHYSDKAQMDTISEYIKREALELACGPWDIAETASNHEKRHNFLQMMELVNKSQLTSRPIKHIIFSHQSRSNRNRESAREIEYAVRNYDVTLHCVRDGFKLTRTSPLEEWIKWDIFNTLNEKFSKDLRRNVWDGMLKKAEQGLFPGKAPFGYKNFRPSEDALSIFKLNSGPADYMKRAFELVVSGIHTVKDVHSQLEVEFSYLASRPKAKRLSELLRNPFYYGDFIFADEKMKGIHPSLISLETWNKAQCVLDSRYHQRVSHKNHHYLGMIKCGGRILNENGEESEELCGAAITAEEKRKKLANGSTKIYTYYHCCNTTRPCSQRNKAFMSTTAKRNPNISESEIELLFESVFQPLSFTKEVCNWMQNILLQEHKTKSKNHHSHMIAIQSRQQMLSSYIDKAYEDKLAGTISEGMWRSKHDKWTKEREQLSQQLAAVDEKKDEYIEDGSLLIELAQNTESIYKNAKPEVKRRLVEIISSNHVLKNGSIEFQYRKPFDILASATPKERWCCWPESNRHGSFPPQDFKSCVSTYFTTAAFMEVILQPSFRIVEIRIGIDLNHSRSRFAIVGTCSFFSHGCKFF